MVGQVRFVRGGFLKLESTKWMEVELGKASCHDEFTREITMLEKMRLERAGKESWQKDG